MLPDRIKELLDSNDIEMVRLGVTLMQKVAPKEQWCSILDAFCYEDSPPPHELWIKKWTYQITKDEIIIIPWTLSDLWKMKKTVSTPLLNMINSKSTIKIENNDKWTWELPLPISQKE